jgi:hypothetical protein
MLACPDRIGIPAVPHSPRNVVLILAMFAGAIPVRELEAQFMVHPGIARAVAAYEAGEFARALALIDSLPPSLPARDQATRFLYRGLIQFAFGEVGLAKTAFARAIQIEPTVRLDPAVHAPSRLAAYLEALDSTVVVWRREAEAAEAAGNLADARRRWSRAAAAMPSDTIARRRLARVEAKMAASPVAPRPARPDSVAAIHPGARPPADSAPASSPRRQYSAGRAAVLGMVVPGLGQVYTDRPVRGLLVFGAAATAVAAGAFYEVVDVECLSIPVDNTCPQDDIVSERSERPYLLPGIGAAAALALAGVIDAVIAARRANAPGRTGAHENARGSPRLVGPSIEPTPHHLRIEFVRLRF